MGDRELKRTLFDEFGRIGKALAGGRRIGENRTERRLPDVVEG